jgi:hypothetical protein
MPKKKEGDIRVKIFMELKGNENKQLIEVINMPFINIPTPSQPLI